MATLTATYLDDLGRIRLELVDPLANVSYRIERSTDGGATWQQVRGAQNLGSMSVTIVDDYEYTPNVENRYRLIAPAFYDSFQREYPVGAALEVRGEETSYASTPVTAALQIVGDIDLRADVMLDSWANGSSQTLLARYDFAADERSFALVVFETGQLRFLRSADGLTIAVAESTVPIPASPGERLAVRATYDASTGEVIFYTAVAMLQPWTQLGDPDSIAATAIHAGTAPLEAGAYGNGTANFTTGKIFSTRVYDGIDGTLVANTFFQNETPGTTNFTDDTGLNWTVHTDAAIVAVQPVPGQDWGTADTGQDWNVAHTSQGFNLWVDNGVGILRSTQPAGRIADQETDSVVGATDSEVTWSAIWPATRDDMDIAVEWAVGLRSSDFASDFYESNLTFSPDGFTVELRIGKFIADVFTELGGIFVGTWNANTPWHVRFRVQGTSLAARAWQEGDTEPADWQLFVTDTDITVGDSLAMRGYKESGDAYEQWFGPISAFTLPQDATTVVITPIQEGVWLKSITYPLLNRILDCVDWEELERTSRTGFFDIKGRHEILGIADVGSSATFSLTFISHSKAENRAIVALLTYGALMLLQPPGDDESIACPNAYSGIPDGYVMVGDSVQSRTVYGKPQWLWTVQFTRVAPNDAAGIIPTTITWAQLWDLIGPDGTWETVWATWDTWQELWLTSGDPLAFFGGSA